MPKDRNKILLISSVALSLLGVGLLFKNSLQSSVTVQRVIRDTAIDAVPAIVNVRSDFAMTISSEETGRVKESSLKLGQKVKQGDLILRIDPTDLEIDIRILKSDIENLEARLALDTEKETELKNRKEDLDNFERLYRTGNYPELEIIRRRREFVVFQENQKLKELIELQELNTLKSRLDKLERRLSKTQIHAPTDGIVTSIFAYPGELVASGSPLATLFSEAVVVEAKINEEDFAGVQPGLDATVRLLTYGNRLYEAQINRVLPTANKDNQQYTVFLDVAIPDEKLLPGLSGEASIVRKKIPNALTIPRRALLGNYVFKVVDNTAVFTPVKVGVRGLNNVEISEGLEEGDQVVTDGMNQLKDGDTVSVND